jgi:hypothetical protein
MSEKEILFPVVQKAVERFYAWLDMMNVEEKECVTNVDFYNNGKLHILHDSGYKVSDEILEIFDEVLHNNPCYAFSFLSEERAAIEKMERLSYVV